MGKYIYCNIHHIAEIQFRLLIYQHIITSTILAQILISIIVATIGGRLLLMLVDEIQKVENAMRLMPQKIQVFKYSLGHIPAEQN